MYSKGGRERRAHNEPYEPPTHLLLSFQAACLLPVHPPHAPLPAPNSSALPLSSSPLQLAHPYSPHTHMPDKAGGKPVPLHISNPATTTVLDLMHQAQALDNTPADKQVVTIITTSVGSAALSLLSVPTDGGYSSASARCTTPPLSPTGEGERDPVCAWRSAGVRLLRLR